MRSLILSNRGPLAEIHDASPEDARTGALFGFVHPGAARSDGFRDAALEQLVRLFGPDAAAPTDLFFKDWSMDPATATPTDQTPLSSHPSYQPIPKSARVTFAATETASQDGGFLEGALAAADAVYANLDRVSLHW